MRKDAPDWAKNIVIPPLYLKPANRLCPLKVGKELFIDSIDHEIHKEMDFRFDVALSETQVVEGDSLLEMVHQMMDLVNGIIPIFEPLLVS
jgi:hypothetical protein